MSSAEHSRGAALAACTACGANAAGPDAFYYLWKGREYSIYRCRSCTHQFVHPAISAEDQASIYSDQYFSAGGDWVCGMFEGGYAEAEGSLRREAREVLAYLAAARGRLLDIGCAGGVFLDEARAAGFVVEGIELNETQAESARRKFGLSVTTGRIEDVPLAKWDGAFDVVTVMDCLEHLPRPLEALRKVAAWTRPGGVVFIRGPLSNSTWGAFKERVRRAVGHRKQLPGYPLDANMFNKRSLTTMLDATGFSVEAWIGTTDIFTNLIARRRSS